MFDQLKRDLVYAENDAHGTSDGPPTITIKCSQLQLLLDAYDTQHAANATLQSELAAVKAENAQLLIDDNAAKDIIERLMAELARAPVKVGYVKKSDAKYMPQINQEMVLIVKGLGLLCPENGYQPIYIDTPEREISHAHKGEEEKR